MGSFKTSYTLLLIDYTSFSWPYWPYKYSPGQSIPNFILQVIQQCNYINTIRLWQRLFTLLLIILFSVFPLSNLNLVIGTLCENSGTIYNLFIKFKDCPTHWHLGYIGLGWWSICLFYFQMSSPTSKMSILFHPASLRFKFHFHRISQEIILFA